MLRDTLEDPPLSLLLRLLHASNNDYYLSTDIYTTITVNYHFVEQTSCPIWCLIRQLIVAIHNDGGVQFTGEEC